MRNIIFIAITFLCISTHLQAQMPFQVRLQVDDASNTLAVQLRNVENDQPTTSQTISSINMRLLGSVNEIISVASTNYTMLMPTTTEPNTQVITMNSTALQCPENWIQNNWVTVVIYNLNPGSYSESNFSVQSDIDGDNSDVQDPIMSVAAAGVYNIPLTIQSTILPITLVSFTAEKQSKSEALLQWESEMEIGFDKFQIERATSSNKFENIGSVDSKGNGRYRFIDKNPQPGKNYYRLKMIDLDGKFEYSSVRELSFENELELILHPNPSLDGNVSFELLGLDSNVSLGLSITDASGKLVKSTFFNGLENNDLNMLHVSNAKGLYYLRFTLSNGHIFTKKLIIGN